MSPSHGGVNINFPSDKVGDIRKKTKVLSEDEKKLDELVLRSGFFIYEISSQLPLLRSFRDRLVISANRITLIKRGAFYIDEYPMQIENLTDAFCFTHMFFSSLTIETFGIPKPPVLKYLIPEEARMARRYLLALIECKKANIDLTELDPEGVREKLKKIGTVSYGSVNDKYHRKMS